MSRCVQLCLQPCPGVHSHVQECLGVPRRVQAFAAVSTTTSECAQLFGAVSSCAQVLLQHVQVCPAVSRHIQMSTQVCPCAHSCSQVCSQMFPAVAAPQPCSQSVPQPQGALRGSWLPQILRARHPLTSVAAGGGKGGSVWGVPEPPPAPEPTFKQGVLQAPPSPPFTHQGVPEPPPIQGVPGPFPEGGVGEADAVGAAPAPLPPQRPGCHP